MHTGYPQHASEQHLIDLHQQFWSLRTIISEQDFSQCVQRLITAVENVLYTYSTVLPAINHGAVRPSQEIIHQTTFSTIAPATTSLKSRKRNVSDPKLTQPRKRVELYWVPPGKKTSGRSGKVGTWQNTAQQLVDEVPYAKNWWEEMHTAGLDCPSDCNAILELISAQSSPGLRQRSHENFLTTSQVSRLKFYAWVTQQQDTNVKIYKAAVAIRQVVLVSACDVLLHAGKIGVTEADEVMAASITDCASMTLDRFRKGVRWALDLLQAVSRKWGSRAEWLIIFWSWSRHSRTTSSKSSYVSRYALLAVRNESLSYIARELEDPKFSDDFQDNPDWPALGIKRRIYDLIQESYPGEFSIEDVEMALGLTSYDDDDDDDGAASSRAESARDETDSITSGSTESIFAQTDPAFDATSSEHNDVRGFPRTEDATCLSWSYQTETTHLSTRSHGVTSDVSNPRPRFLLQTQITVPDTAQSIQFAIKGDIDSLKLLFSQGLASPRDVSDSRQFSLVRWALYGGRGNFETVKFLLDQGAFVDEESYHHSWDLGFRRICSIAQLKQLHCILLNPPSIYTFKDWAEEQRFPPIHQIVLGRSNKPLRAQLDDDPNAVYATDAMGRTALDWATARAQLSDMRLLIDYDSPVDTINEDGRSTVLHAVDSHDDDALRIILEAGAIPDPKLPDGVFRSSPLIAASFGGLRGMVKLLIEFGAKLELCNPEGRTALQTAAIMQHADCADILVSYGADISDNEYSALRTALSSNSHAVLKIFVGKCNLSCLGDLQLLPIIAKSADVETMSIIGSSPNLLKQTLANAGGFDVSRQTLLSRTDYNEMLGKGFDELQRKAEEAAAKI